MYKAGRSYERVNVYVSALLLHFFVASIIITLIELEVMRTKNEENCIRPTDTDQHDKEDKKAEIQKLQATTFCYNI